MEVKAANLQGLQTEWGGGEIKGLLPPVEDEVNRYFGGISVGEKQTNRCHTEVEAVATHLRK